MTDLFVIGIVVVVVAVAMTYIVKEKKRGAKCIGCPSGGSCGKKNCDCHTDEK